MTLAFEVLILQKNYCHLVALFFNVLVGYSRPMKSLERSNFFRNSMMTCLYSNEGINRIEHIISPCSMQPLNRKLACQRITEYARVSLHML